MPKPPARTLETLADAVGAREIRNAAPVAVTDLAFDAAAVTPGSLFACVP